MNQQSNNQNRQQQQHNQSNRPQQNPNAPDPQNRNQPNTNPNFTETEQPDNKQQEQVVAKPKKENLKQVLTRLVTEVLSGELGAEASRRKLHDWYHAMSTDEQQDFKASRVQADETMNNIKGVVDTLAQELPALYVA